MTTIKKLAPTVLLLCITVFLTAQTQITYEFEKPLYQTNEDGYTEFYADKCYNLGEEGNPLLPYYGANLLLPPGTEIKEIRLISVNYGETLNDIKVKPAAGQFPISKGAPDNYTVVPNEAIYSSANNYPASIFSEANTYFLAGHSIGSFSICPLIYYPASRIVKPIKSISLEIITESTDRAVLASKTLKNHSTQIRRIKNIVDNESALSQYAYTEDKTLEYDILFITDQALAPFFEPYINFKSSTGFIVETVTTDNIYSNYTGVDEAEKIRNCIIDYYTNYNIFAVILGGDADKNNPSTNFVPHRGFYGSVDNDLDVPADMYFACLDGTWNDDNDQKWGEPGEDDLFAELIVGRLAVDDSTEIAHFMHKQIMYQNQPVIDDIEKALMIGESLDSYTWGGDSKDEIADGSANHGHTTVGVSSNFSIDYLYERDGFWNKQDVYSQFNNTGVNLINHLGHSNVDYNMKMYSSNVNTTNFTNDGITHGYGIGYSQGCYNGSFDNRGTTSNAYGGDCFAEKITTIENAEVACVANSRYGLYSPGNTNGASQYFDREFYDAIFGEGLTMIGEANGDSKSDLAGFIANDNGLRWCCYILNVFGDPTMDIWTAVPTAIAADYPAAVPLGATEITFQTDAPGARIGLMQNGNLIGRGLTDANGDLVLELFSQLKAIDSIQVSMILHNRTRHLGNIVVVAGQAFVCYESHSINDTLTGNGNGLPEYGETSKLSLRVNNMGQQDATDVTVSISSNDPYVVITDSSEYYGNIGQGQSVIVSEGFEFSLTSDVPDGHEVLFNLRAEGQDNWESNFAQAVCAPAFSSGLFVIDDNAGGNGNGLLDPGETAELIIQLINSGHSRAINITGDISSGDSLVTIISANVLTDTLEIGEIFEATYTISTHPLSQLGATFDLTHDIESGPYTSQRTYAIDNGIICEDFETGDFSHYNWAQLGNAPWIITDINTFEGEFSSKSGVITHGERSTLQAALYVEEVDSISFYFKTSSESNDYLNFYINNALVDKWSGMNDWQKVSYPVSSGVKFFKWEYSKNTTVSSGEDCAWVDYIVLPFVNTASAYAGPDQLICETGVCMLEGQAINYNSFEWSTIGDGSFDDPEILDPVYTPGPGDISIGEVFLTLATTFNQNGTTFDEMHLSIDGNPGIPELPSGPEYVDLLTTNTSEYSTILLPGISEYDWMLEPAEAGTIDGSSENVIITWNNTYNGQVYLSVRAIDSCGPSVFSSALEVMVDEGGLGVNEAAKEISLGIYPNPSNGIFNLVSTLSIADANIKVYNIIGELVYNEQKDISKGECINIRLNDALQGLYILLITAGEDQFTEKLIVK
jgi:hypothetical protein